MVNSDDGGGLKRRHAVPSDARPVWSQRLRGAVSCVAAAESGVLVGTARGDVVHGVDGREVSRLAAHGGRVVGVQPTEAGIVTAGADGRVRLWGPAGPRATLELGTEATCLAARPDGIWIGGADGAVRWWHPRAEAEARRLGHAAPITAIAPSGDGALSGDAAGTLWSWTREEGRVVETGAPVVGLVRAGLHHVVARADGTLTVLLGEARLATRAVGAVTALAATGDRVWAACGRQVTSWRVPDLEPLGQHLGPAPVTALTAAGGRLWTGSESGEVLAWDEPWAPERAVLWHEGAVRGVAFGPGVLASVGRDGHLRLWDPGSGKSVAAFTGPEGGVEAVDVQLGELATAGADGTVRLWTVDGPIWTKRVSAASLSAVCLSEGCVVAAGHDGRVHVNDRSTGRRMHSLEGHSERIRCLARHPSGLVGSAGYDGVLAVWEPREGRALGHVVAHPGPVIGLCALDGGWATASLDGTVALWDPASTRLATLEAHEEGAVGVVPVGSDGLVTAGLDGTVRLWSVSRRCCTAELRLGQPLMCLAASGRQVAVGARSGDLFVLEAEA